MSRGAHLWVENKNNQRLNINYNPCKWSPLVHCIKFQFENCVGWWCRCTSWETNHEDTFIPGSHSHCSHHHQHIMYSWLKIILPHQTVDAGPQESWLFSNWYRRTLMTFSWRDRICCLCDRWMLLTWCDGSRRLWPGHPRSCLHPGMSPPQTDPNIETI